MKVRTKLLSLLNILLILFLLSCANMTGPETSNINFELGDDIVSLISKAAENDALTTDTIKIQCEMPGLKLPAQSVEVEKQNIGKTTITISDIPFGVEFRILVKVFFNSVVIYQGESNPIILKLENNGENFDISIKEKRGTIRLDYDGAESIPAEFPANTPIDYYFDTQDIILPENLSKTGYDFLGWFVNLNTENEKKVTRLGETNYLGDVTVKIKWRDNVLPGEIYKGDSDKGIIIKPGDTKLTFYWENPKDEDFDHANLYKENKADPGTLIKIASISGTPGEISSYELTGLTNYETNKYEIKTVDKTGNESPGCILVPGTSYDSVPESVKHNTVKVLPSETSGTYGTNGLYVTFGDYPQTVATASEAASIDESKLYVFNNMACYGDGAGNYYVKKDAYPEGESWGSGCHFKDGSHINRAPYYFKIEPVKWRVLTLDYSDVTGNKGALLLAEDGLSTYSFSEYTDKSYAFADSKIRCFLNSDTVPYMEEIYDYMMGPEAEPVFERHIRNCKAEGMLNNAFSTTAINNIIQPVKLTSSSKEDYIFLLSDTEIINKYGFPGDVLTDPSELIPSRVKVPSDYARAEGCFINPDANDSCRWWTRNPNRGNYSNFVVDLRGTYLENSSLSPTDRQTCAVPAIVVPKTLLGNVNLKPGNVTEFKGYYDRAVDKIKLSWKNSSYEDANKVIISDGANNYEFTNKETACEIDCTGKIENIYNFTAVCYDALNQSSSPVKLQVVKGVGEFVLKDDTRVYYKDIDSAKKGDIVSFIYGTNGTKLMGIALNEKTGQDNGLLWGPDSSNIPNIVCSDDRNNITGDIDGSDNWTEIRKVDSSGTYPAFDYANSYGNNLPAGSLETLKTGWYIPTVKEILDIYDNLNTVQSGLEAAGGTKITDWYWWSSNQHATESTRAYQIPFMGNAPGTIAHDTKHGSKKTVRCIKQFEFK